MGWLPELGELVLGKYRVVRALGQGGMGVVFEAVNIATDGRVAIKMLKPSLDETSERSSRMSREARASAKLRSRFVARVFDFDHTSSGAPVLVMELLEGRDLSAELRRTPAALLPIEEAVSYVVQACAGVAEAHALGIIHRDLKPGNLFLDGSSGAPMVRVLDFGLSKHLAGETTNDLTAPSEALGTLAYMSPEQMRATKNVDARTDVWSLGVVLYRALMGKLPLTEKGYAIAARLIDSQPMPRVDREDVPRELAHIVARALEKDASKRFRDARELGKALVPFLVAPSSATKLAIEELGAVARSPGSYEDRSLADTDDTTAASTTRTVDAVDERTSVIAPPPRRSRRKRDLWQLASRETKMVLAGSGVLALATLLIAATSSSSPAPASPPAAAPPPPVIYLPPPVATTAPATATPPSASTMPATAPASPPRARPRPAAAPRSRDNENPGLL